jgi:hypothetical protein
MYMCFKNVNNSNRSVLPLPYYGFEKVVDDPNEVGGMNNEEGFQILLVSSVQDLA